jgi:hypothetical protein
MIKIRKSFIKLGQAIMLSMLILTVLTSCASKEIGLNFNVKKGDNYKVTEKVFQKISMKIEGKEIQTNQNSEITFTYKIIDKDKEEISTINATYDSIIATASGGGESFQYDSTKNNNDKNDPLSNAYSGFIGKSFTFKVDKSGKVLSLEGIDKIIEEVVGKLSVSDEKVKNQVKDEINSVFGDEAVKGFISSVTGTYPNKKLKQGESWETVEIANVGIPISAKVKYTLKEGKEENYFVDAASTIEAKNDTPIDFQGEKATFNFNGDESGTLKYSKDSGIIENANFSIFLSGNLKFQKSKTFPKEITVPAEVYSNIKLTMQKQ